VLSEKTEVELQAIERAKNQARQSRLQTVSRENVFAPATEKFVSRTLARKSPESLVATTLKMNFVEVQRSSHDGSSSARLFRGPKGEKIAVQERADRVFLHSSKIDAIHRVVRQHTQDRVTEHLARKGFQVETKSTLAGEETVAREVDDLHGDGQAVIGVTASEDGRLRVDVDGLKSDRCQEIVNDIAESLGGRVTVEKPKDARWSVRRRIREKARIR